MQLTEMNGRPVATRPVSALYDPPQPKCADCDAPATLVIYELTEHQPAFHDKWYWCGNCDLGG